MAENIDRSLAFTVLLEADPGGFGKQDMDTAGQTIGEFLTDWKGSGVSDMYDYARGWVRDRQETADKGEVESATSPDPREAERQAWNGALASGDEERIQAAREAALTAVHTRIMEQDSYQARTRGEHVPGVPAGSGRPVVVFNPRDIAGVHWSWRPGDGIRGPEWEDGEPTGEHMANSAADVPAPDEMAMRDAEAAGMEPGQ